LKTKGLIKKMKVNKKPPWGEKAQDARKADRNIKYCIKCKKCWESIYYGSKQNTYHYFDFPTYGKQKELCNYCKGENNGKNKSFGN